jgi:1-deoxy-D-xylulose-5-phosphate synthase
MWTDVFSEALLDLARRDRRIVAITAAMPDGTGLVPLRRHLPQQYVDVGINESHAVALAAGLAKAGLRPVVAVYSTFLQRAFDQIFQEVAIQNLPVIFCMDRAGLVGADGPTHQGLLDIAFLRPLPGMVLMSPADGAELRSAMDLALTLDAPCAIRYPREEVPDAPPDASGGPFVLARACRLRPGADGTFLALGAMVEHALHAAQTLSDRDHAEVAVYSARFAKPLDEDLIAGLIQAGKPLLTVEDHAVACGFGSAVLELAAARSLAADGIRLLGVPDRLVAHASRSEQLAQVGLDADGLARAMLRSLRPRRVSEHARP